MRPRIWITSVLFSDGTTIEFSKSDIIIVVGPNNSGKSATLKDVLNLVLSDSHIGKVVKRITLQKEGDEVDLLNFLESSCRKYLSDREPHYESFGTDINESGVKSWWKNFHRGLNRMTPFFVNTLTTEARINAANPPTNIKLTSESPKHPIHVMQKHDTLEKKFSEYFKQAFGEELILNRGAGNEVPLYIGIPPVMEDNEDRVSESYLRKLEKLDLLHQQGDGMRSFVGVLLNAFVSNHSVLLIDEPEAFLHPPQARLLGKMLAKDLPAERQLFLATHSEDFLKGLLDANATNLKIIRIQREANVNKVCVINDTDISNVWKDSLLRHSNVLNGLFHSSVIICESDSDCRFYSAVLAAIHDNTESIAPDILFMHCGGKHRMPTAVNGLKKLDVKIKVVSDFDVLNDINPLKQIFESLGGIWANVENDWKIVKKEIEQKKPELLKADLETNMNKIFQGSSEAVFPAEKISEIQKLLKKASAWSIAKEVGKTFIPSGQATQAFERIQEKFIQVGLLIPEVGELEGFVKSVGNHGPKWVSEVLMKDLKTDKELEQARHFVTQFEK